MLVSWHFGRWNLYESMFDFVDIVDLVDTLPTRHIDNKIRGVDAHPWLGLINHKNYSMSFKEFYRNLE